MPKPLPLLEESGPVCCAPLGADPDALTAEDAVGVAVRLKALADPARLQIIDFLKRQPSLEACTCDLAPVVGLTEATTSHHLKQLLQAGMVRRRRAGMNVYYALVPDAVSAVARVLDVGESASVAVR